MKRMFASRMRKTRLFAPAMLAGEASGLIIPAKLTVSSQLAFSITATSQVAFSVTLSQERVTNISLTQEPDN